MRNFDVEVARRENRTPLFYYPYHIELKSDFAKFIIARYFYRKTTSYYLSFDKQKHLTLLNEENMKGLSGRHTFHYDDPQETESERISIVKHMAPVSLGRREVDGFRDYVPGVTTYNPQLREGEDFEIVVGSPVEIEQPEKITFDDLPDLMGVESEQ